MTVTLQRLDHVNIRTANLDAMVAWYRDMLGLETGPRPGFAFPGAWLYAGEHAIVHLIGRDVAPAGPQQDLHLEHFDRVPGLVRDNSQQDGLKLGSMAGRLGNRFAGEKAFDK